MFDYTQTDEYAITCGSKDGDEYQTLYVKTRFFEDYNGMAAEPIEFCWDGRDTPKIVSRSCLMSDLVRSLVSRRYDQTALDAVRCDNLEGAFIDREYLATA